METLKYTVIKNKAQYKKYCQALEELMDSGSKNKTASDEIDLLTLLIEKWDAEHNRFMEVDPIRLLHSFMEDHKMKAKDLVELLNVAKAKSLRIDYRGRPRKVDRYRFNSLCGACSSVLWL